MKNKKIIILIACAVLLVGIGKFAADKSENSAIAVNGIIDEDLEFDEVVADISPDDMFDAGFEYGDSCTVTFSNGAKYEDVPFYSGYFGNTNELCVVHYQTEDFIRIVRCSGDSIWDEVGCEDGDSVLISLQSKGEYLTEQEVMNMTYSDNREDYVSDEEFANFRAISCDGIKQNMFYRGASPVNNVHNRASYVDQFLKENNIQFVLDLADTQANLDSYMAKDDFKSDYFMSLYNEDKVALLGLTASYRTDAFKQKLVAGLLKMMENEGPYYIHCTEGKDRTGFVCILLECIAGCDYEDIEKDYMITYYNYFDIDENTNKESYDAILDLRFYDMMNWLHSVEEGNMLQGVNLEGGAKAYLLSGGMSLEDYEKLKELVSE